ncbi:MAG: uroporphyrinogen decarboxylase family protein, partial [Ruthenibacterium sp.]
MNVRERFRAVMNGTPVDTIPVLEWASWWDKTLDIWEKEGLPAALDERAMQDYFGIAHHKQFWLSHKAATCPKDASYGGGILKTMEDYERLRPHLLPEDAIERLVPQLLALQKEHENGDTLLWYTVDGFFWWPRVLLGIENHLYSFYDEPELYHKICEDLLQWQIKMIDEMAKYVKPDFMTIAEDMSYNHGPMVSKELFDTFLLPYYRRLVPEIQKHGTRVFVDSD